MGKNLMATLRAEAIFPGIFSEFATGHSITVPLEIIELFFSRRQGNHVDTQVQIFGLFSAFILHFQPELKTGNVTVRSILSIPTGGLMRLLSKAYPALVQAIKIPILDLWAM